MTVTGLGKSLLRKVGVGTSTTEAPTTTPTTASPTGGVEQTSETSEAKATQEPQAITGAHHHALGIDPTRKEGPAELGHSRILDVLGGDRFAPIKAVQVDGKVAWFNFALARELGFAVEGDAMTPELHQRILQALAYRVLAPGEDAGGKPVVELFADRYGGTGMGNNEGAGRAAFLPWGNLNIKGVGRTPLAKITEQQDFHHAHGGAPMREGLIEAAWGEVGSNLFSRGSSRILAIIDVGDYTQWQNGSKEKRALIIRAGHQLRPAHVLKGFDQGGAFSERVFVSMAQELGLLVQKQGPKGLEPDLPATMGKLIEQHAATQAEQQRWRIVHGAISTGNMQMDGAQLDLATMSTQARTADIKTIRQGGSFFHEIDERAAELARMYAALRASLGKEGAKRAPPLDVSAELGRAYKRELTRQMLDATGLKPSLGEVLLRDQPAVCERLTKAIQALARLGNGGDLLADKRVVDDAVVDVFNALRAYPSLLLAGEATHEARVAQVLELLRPNVLGSEKRKQEQLAKVTQLAHELVDVLDAVYAFAASKAEGHYDSLEAMRRSIAARAAFENEPIEALYKAPAHEMFDHVVDEFGKTGDAKLLTEAIDKLAASSVRSFEALLELGGKRRIPGGIEIERRTIDGIDHSVRAFDDGKRRLHLSIPLQGDEAAGFTLSTLPGAPQLSKADVEALRYRFTVDGWQTTQEVQARLEPDERGHLALSFDIPAIKGAAGRLEGVFHVETNSGLWIKDGASNFRGYTFAVPDKIEAAAMAQGLAG
ncbi:MAG: hypothetical protein IT383_28305 [Deltaproteobacteria bacterium]|nr:hypothetical protein [Deltaproteobacteria bacterium]